MVGKAPLNCTVCRRSFYPGGGARLWPMCSAACTIAARHIVIAAMTQRLGEKSVLIRQAAGG